jgi:uncharacterized radical SAM superfamily protein
VALPKFYFPGKKFPAVSITGEHCTLSCAHCNAHYLKGMVECKTPEALVKLAHELEREGANGFLLSGGCDSEGKVPLDRFYPAIRDIKSSTGLRINIHVGLLKPEDAREVAGLGADAISVDVLGDDETITDVYGLEATRDDYEIMLKSLAQEGANVVPHITAGIHFGKLRGEDYALKMIEQIEPRALIINALLPTKDTGMADVEVASKDFLSVLSNARKRFPGAEVIMGCMRPRSAATENEALRIGLDGIVLPSRKTMREFEHEKIELCCALVR